MRINLDPGDRWLLIACGIVLVAVSVAGILMVPQRVSGPRGIPSTYSSDSAGAKAAYLLLGRLGYKEERWDRSPTELPKKAQNVTLILAEPFIPATPEEKTAILSFVRRGGRVVVTGVFGANLLDLPGIVPASEFEPDWQKFPAELPGPISERAPTVLMQAQAWWKGGQPDDLEYYGSHDGGTVVRFPLGRGTIVWWASCSPLNNYGLTQASNMEFLLNSVGGAREERVLWDEYFHGVRPGLWSYMEKTPLPWAMLQMAILALALVLTYTRRSGPVVALTQQSRLSPMEFVETVGDLYSHKRAAAGAVTIAAQRFRSLLARRLGRSPDDVSEIAQDTFGEELGIASLLSRCQAAPKSGNTNEAQALKLVQEIHDCIHRLRLVEKGD